MICKDTSLQYFLIMSFWLASFLFAPSFVFAADDPAPIDLQVYIPGVSTEKRECAIGEIGKACATDEECNKSIEGKTIKGRCVTKATATVDPDDKTGGVISYIGGMYKFLVGIAALAAVFMIMIAGYRWLFAGGNSGAIDDAKTRIKGAIAGLAIALLSYSILNLINPELVSLKLENVPEPIQAPKEDDEDAIETVEKNISAQCPQNVTVLAPDKSRVSGNTTVCGSRYTFENQTPELLKEYPDGQCLGTVCYDGVKVGEYLTGKTVTQSKEICAPKTRAQGFECSKVGWKGGTVTTAARVVSEATCPQAKLSECETTASQLVIKATRGDQFCKKVIAGYDKYDKKEKCVAKKVGACPNEGLRVTCDGKKILDSQVTWGFRSVADFRFGGFSDGVIPKECANVKKSSNDTGLTLSCSDIVIPDNIQHLCCAKTNKLDILNDIGGGKHEVIDCRETVCNRDEIKVECPIFDNQPGEITYHSSFRKNQKSLCRAGGDGKGVCCWEVESHLGNGRGI